MSLKVIWTGGTYQNYNVITCEGAAACLRAIFINVAKVICLGAGACESANFTNVGEVECDAVEAEGEVCRNAKFTNIEKPLVCKGGTRTERSCYQADIRNVKGLQCVGNNACREARIENITDQQLTCDSTSSDLYACYGAKIYGGSNLKVTCDGVSGCRSAKFYDVQSVTCAGLSNYNCYYAYFANNNGKYNVKCLSTSGSAACRYMTCNLNNIGGTSRSKHNTFTSC